MIYSLFVTLVVTIDRIGVNIANNVFHKNWLYFINKRAMAKVYRDMSSLTAAPDQISDASIVDIMDARKIAIDARRMFDGCNPRFYGDHWHYQEVKLEVLATRVSTHGKSKLWLADGELKILQERFNWASTRMDTISFSKFCLFLGEALHDTREFLVRNEDDVKDSLSSAANQQYMS